MSEANAKEESVRLVLKAAVAEARSVPEVLVYRERVMKRANIADVEAFWEVADYLAERRYITEGSSDYWTFAVTSRGTLEAAG